MVTRRDTTVQGNFRKELIIVQNAEHAKFRDRGKSRLWGVQLFEIGYTKKDTTHGCTQLPLETQGASTPKTKKNSGKDGRATRCFQLTMALLIKQNSLKREMDKGAKLFFHSDLHMQMTNPKMEGLGEWQSVQLAKTIQK